VRAAEWVLTGLTIWDGIYVGDQQHNSIGVEETLGTMNDLNAKKIMKFPKILRNKLDRKKINKGVQNRGRAIYQDDTIHTK